MRTYKLRESIIGKKTKIDIKDKNDNLLIKKGKEITPSKYYLLKKHNIEFVKIESPNPKDEDLNNLDAREIKTFESQDTSQIIKRISETHSFTEKQIRNMLSEIPLNIPRIIKRFLKKINSIKDDELIKIKNIHNYIFEHQITVTILTTYIGFHYGFRGEKLEKLANASLIYDFGNFLIDNRILDKKERLTKIEKKILKSHVQLGYNFLKKNTDFSFEELLPVLQHHERINGTGYPKGLNEKMIHDYSKIISVADVYDAMTTDRPHRLAYTQQEVFEYLMASAGTLYDKKIIDLFIKKINPYPVGTRVVLSNGTKGFVFNTNIDNPLRPIVISMRKDYKNGYINLLENKNIIIKDISPA